MRIIHGEGFREKERQESRKKEQMDRRTGGQAGRNNEGDKINRATDSSGGDKEERMGSE